MSDRLIDILLAIAACVIVMFVLIGAARFVGLGRCLDCRRGCPPWSVYCWRHGPDAGDR